MDALYKPFFPNLADVVGKKTSDATPAYNCIAWAFKETHRVWWPDSRAYWPIPYAGMTQLEAFENWFDVDGWVDTTDPGVETGFEKIALFLLNGVPTHAARLLPNGQWTSKLGWHPTLSIDLAHDLHDLEGGHYGAIFKIYRKTI